MEDLDSLITETNNLRKEIPTSSKERAEEIIKELENVGQKLLKLTVQL
jgi:hypothetical protein